jgi:acyl-coenzyme A synthetase/AMP-(fatty) acid ligase
MTPDAVFLQERLPKTSSGKIDRVALAHGTLEEVTSVE